MSEPDGNGERIEVELPQVTAPTLPSEHTLTNSTTFYQRTLGDGMLIKFVPLVATPQGYMPAPEAYVISFNAEAWQRFKREVAADGVKSQIIEARHLNGGQL